MAKSVPQSALELTVRSLRITPSTVERKLVAFIRRKVKEAGIRGGVVGMSGGIDSSAIAVLSVKALGRGNVLGICTPEAGVTDPSDVADAREVARGLGIGFKVIDIAPVVLGIGKNLPWFRAGARIPAANIKPRLRMTILYYYANLLNRLVVGSGNRSEIRAGYFTKFGDGAVDLQPIGCLYKTQVKQLAEYLNIPERIIEKVPSAGLWGGQTDEGELGLPYEKLDLIYAGLDLGLKPAVIAKVVGMKTGDVKRFIEREQKTAHKRGAPEIPSI